MVRRSTRSDDAIDAPRLLAALSECRRALIEASTKARPQGPLYNACGMVIAAIDACATYLTRNPYYFHTHGHSHLAAKPGPVGERQDGG